MFRVLLLLLFCSSLTCAAQTKTIFRSQVYAGLLESESAGALQVQTINGVGYKNWFGGVGTGIDWGGTRSIPLFLSVNKFLNSTKLPLYFSGDLGTNFVWRDDRNRQYILDPGKSEYDGALYWATGVGWKFGMKKNNNAVLLNFGYNNKRVIKTLERSSPCLIPPCPVDKTTYDYRLRRLSLRVGWMF